LNILGVGITPANFAQAVAALDKWESGRQARICVTVHGLVTAQRDPEIRNALKIPMAAPSCERAHRLVW
jgi:N-acetylglucosaminyldiphosphoundecaprenol N-acetyl-beta-D-mannosaminyltransferase